MEEEKTFEVNLTQTLSNLKFFKFSSLTSD